MAMPADLWLVRHGQSEANIIIHAAMNGDTSYYEGGRMEAADSVWRLTSKGVRQAKTIGEFINVVQPSFDRYIVSPYVRTLETAANMKLNGALWEKDRTVRERSWGEINAVPQDSIRDRYELNLLFKQIDPLYWRPSSGESIAELAEIRVHNMLTRLKEKSTSNDSVIVVSHGEFMSACRLVIEEIDDDRYLEMLRNKKYEVQNCQAMHYTRRDPNTGRLAERFGWLQLHRIVENEDGSMSVRTHSWKEFGRETYTNDELEEYVNNVPHRLTDDPDVPFPGM